MRKLTDYERFKRTTDTQAIVQQYSCGQWCDYGWHERKTKAAMDKFIDAKSSSEYNIDVRGFLPVMTIGATKPITQPKPNEVLRSLARKGK